MKKKKTHSVCISTYEKEKTHSIWIMTLLLMALDSVPDGLFHKRPAHWLYLTSAGWHREQDRMPSLVLGPSSVHSEAIQPHDAGFSWCRGVLHFCAWGHVEGERLWTGMDENLLKLRWCRVLLFLCELGNICQNSLDIEITWLSCARQYGRSDLEQM